MITTTSSIEETIVEQNRSMYQSLEEKLGEAEEKAEAVIDKVRTDAERDISTLEKRIHAQKEEYTQYKSQKQKEDR